VRPGDTLAVIDVPEIAARLDQARGAVASARAQYEMARSGATELRPASCQAQIDAAQAQYDYARVQLHPYAAHVQ
jgi:HlyD family secretion protein